MCLYSAKQKRRESRWMISPGVLFFFYSSLFFRHQHTLFVSSIKVHRLIIIDDQQHILGILSMSDLMRFLISTSARTSHQRSIDHRFVRFLQVSVEPIPIHRMEISIFRFSKLNRWRVNQAILVLFCTYPFLYHSLLFPCSGKWNSRFSFLTHQFVPLRVSCFGWFFSLLSSCWFFFSFNRESFFNDQCFSLPLSISNERGRKRRFYSHQRDTVLIVFPLGIIQS